MFMSNLSHCAPASTNTQCDIDTGSCTCQPGVTGYKCDACIGGFWNYQDSGCEGKFYVYIFQDKQIR